MRSVGFGRGFDTYVELRHPEPLETPGFVSDVADRAKAWLNHYGNERFFLFLHTYQVHAPYEPPPGFSPTKEQAARFGPQRSPYTGEAIFATYGKKGAPVDLDAAARDRVRAPGYIEVAASESPEDSPAKTATN